MKKHLAFMVVSLLLISGLSAQDYLDFNSGSDQRKKILLVPFDPRIYINDATAIMASVEGETHDEIMQYFRYQLNLQLYNSMMDSCTIISLFTDNTRADQEDINGLYSVISYELGLAMENNPEDPESEEKKGFLARKREEKAQEQRQQEASQYKTHVENGELVSKRQTTADMNLNIVFHQPEVLVEIASRRNVDLFLLINQFEIQGNYGDPYLTGNSKAERTIKVHFSLFNTQGVMVHGSFAKVTIPLDLDDKQEIANLYFPELIRQIIHNIDF